MSIPEMGRKEEKENMKAAAIQMKVEADKKGKYTYCGTYLEQVAQKGIDIAVLPEMFCCPYQTEKFHIYAEKEREEVWKTDWPIYYRKYGIYLVAGSMPELGENGKVYNTAYVFDRNGRQIGKHRKIHLFDIDVEGGQF